MSQTGSENRETPMPPGHTQTLSEIRSQLEQSRAREKQLEQSLSHAQSQRDLAACLAAAGAVDIDAAVVLADRQMQNDGTADPAQTVTRLQKEKPWLFQEAKSAPNLPGPTQNPRTRVDPNKRTLTEKAKTAARTGSRKDIHEYMRARRTAG